MDGGLSSQANSVMVGATGIGANVLVARPVRVCKCVDSLYG